MILGIGLDITEIDRVRLAYQRQGTSWLSKNFTKREIALLPTIPDPSPHLAARWAAKEATYKALHTTTWIPYTDAEILGGYGSPPSLHLHGLALQRFQDLGGSNAHLSLTHSDSWAAASVLLVREATSLPPGVTGFQTPSGWFDAQRGTELDVGGLCPPKDSPSKRPFLPLLPPPSTATDLQDTLPNLPLLLSQSDFAPLAMIAAVGRFGEIGYQGTMPWSYPADLRRFRRITQGHAVIMGRRTFESLDRPLSDRLMIVVSRTPLTLSPGLLQTSSLPEALALARNHDDFPFVIGGRRLFEEALPFASHLFLTDVGEIPQADVSFPPIPWAEWFCLSYQTLPPLRFLTFQRRSSPSSARS